MPPSRLATRANRSLRRLPLASLGANDASRVPPEWHGWLHHTFKEPPTKDAPKTKPWEREHRVNMSGTDGAYRPQGSLAKTGIRPPATGDYQAWKPE